MKAKTIGFWRGRWPHGEVEGGKYLVTMRLKGAIPKVALDGIREQSEALRQVDQTDESEVLRIQRLIQCRLRTDYSLGPTRRSGCESRVKSTQF